MLGDQNNLQPHCYVAVDTQTFTENGLYSIPFLQAAARLSSQWTFVVFNDGTDVAESKLMASALTKHGIPALDAPHLTELSRAIFNECVLVCCPNFTRKSDFQGPAYRCASTPEMLDILLTADSSMIPVSVRTIKEIASEII